LLEDTLRRVEADKSDRRETLRQEALELAGHMIEQWPTARWYPRSEDKPSSAARMLTLLARLGAAKAIEAFVVRATADGDYGRGEDGGGGLAIVRYAQAVGDPDPEVRAAAFGTCAALLARAAGKLSDVSPAARLLVEAMPGDPAKAERELAWRRGSMQPEHVVDLFRALVATDRTLAQRAAAHVLAWPKTYDLDRILVPALRAMQRVDAAIEPVRAACLAHLRARAAEPLAPPADWRRAAFPPCEHCTALSNFLSPTQGRGSGSCASEPTVGVEARSAL
jgi:hypothetical protein